jgi:hypothetical protein
MAELIDLTKRFPHQDNLIALEPLEWRRADWLTGYVMLCTREESQRFEAHRLEACRVKGHQHIGSVPNHFRLDEGYHYTAMGLFRHHADEGAMRRVYYLAGLMEAVTNAPSAILRTDLLRRVYQSILEERERLGVVWRGHVRHFLLPLNPDYYNANLLFHRIGSAESLKDLFHKIQAETDTQFDILAQHYVFYMPECFLTQATLHP